MHALTIISYLIFVLSASALSLRNTCVGVTCPPPILANDCEVLPADPPLRWYAKARENYNAMLTIGF